MNLVSLVNRQAEFGMFTILIEYKRVNKTNRVPWRFESIDK